MNRRGQSLNLPNLLTLSRIGLIPVFVALFLIEPSPFIAVLSAAVFAVASVTDWLDGYVARRRQQITDLGKLLDPIADKVLVLAALVVLVEAQRAPGWLVIILLAREFAITALRAVAAIDGHIIAADRLGKWKMAAQTAAVIVLILEPALPAWAHPVGLGLLVAATALALVSGWQYAATYRRTIGSASTP
ncbi:MAG: CDP-diacylglycerol--glycerol-3-phosphate 3-phosphatidyltransferase [Nitrospirota bacterium]